MSSSYISLAKLAVESYIKERKVIEPPKNLEEEFFKRKSGVFVTIKKNGWLRGCIGTYLPTKENIAQEIISNAIAAAVEDYRFAPIQEQELNELSYTVYILNKPELIKDTSELDPKKYGILVTTRPINYSQKIDVVFNDHPIPKSGLLLPNLEGINTAKEQISIACQKAGIDENKEKIIIYKFSVEKYEE